MLYSRFLFDISFDSSCQARPGILRPSIDFAYLSRVLKTEKLHANPQVLEQEINYLDSQRKEVSVLGKNLPSN